MPTAPSRRFAPAYLRRKSAEITSWMNSAVNRTAATRFVTGGHIDRTEYRAQCHCCRRPRAFCYCALIEAFDSETRFVILTQPREAKHSFGTGRMAHLSLRNSLLVEGVDFSADERIHRELHSPNGFPVLLFPGKGSINLSRQSPEERMALVPAGRQLIVFVLDGTWKSVRKMLRLSPKLGESADDLFRTAVAVQLSNPPPTETPLLFDY